MYFQERFNTILFLAFTITTAGQPIAPILRIETGMHSAMGNRISADAAGKFLLSSSIDKTARLWDATTGTLLNIFRIPVGGIDEGKLYCCSLSPDAKIAALAGSTGAEWEKTYCIYLVNTQTGEIFHRIKGLPEFIADLKFSPNGRWLGAGLSGSNGVRIFDTYDWGETKKLEGYKSHVYNIEFKPGGGLATACFDGKLRLYNSQFELLEEKRVQAGKRVYSIAFNPAGNKLAVGYMDAATVEVRDGSDLSLLYKPSVKGTDNIDGSLENLSFSADGSKLFGGGIFQKISREGDSKFVVRCWNNEGEGSYSDLLLTKNSILNIIPLPDGSMAVMGGYPDMAVISSSNNVSWYLSAGNNNFGSRDISHFKINNSGSSIGFKPYSQPDYSFDVLQRKLLKETSQYPSPIDVSAGTAVTNWRENTMPVINGKDILFLKENEICHSTDISSTGNKIALGTIWNLYLSDNNAQKIWKTTLPDLVQAVNISGNDKVVAALLYDGTIRWYNMETGKELLVFYLHADKKRWVLFTPSGYYDASPGAEDFLGWHLNNGPDKTPSFFPISRFKEKYYRPDVIDAIFETYNEEEAITLANQLSSKKVTTTVVSFREKLPPTIIINSPANGSNFSENTISVSYSINSPQDAPVKNLRVLVDGRPVKNNWELNPAAIFKTQKLTFTVPSKSCTITLLAENDNGTSPEANLYLKWVSPAAYKEEVVYKPKLYVLAIGISDYQNVEKLGLASKDASDFVNTIVKQKGNLGLYSDVIVKKLIDNDATKDAITDGLQWIQDQPTQHDVAMIFYSGHGINDNSGSFYLVPVAADIERIKTTCLYFEELKHTVSNIAGKVVVFIDACHSGNVMGLGQKGYIDINSIVNELSSAEDGAFTFTSSTGKEVSLENPEWGNGAFTKALIEGLDGKAAIPGKNKVTLKSLDFYISERVKEITKGKQHPTSVPPPNVPDFPIAVTQ